MISATQTRAQVQQTLGGPVHFSGKGLHTGALCHVSLFPAEPHTGIVFQRIDLPQQPLVPALAAHVSGTQRDTIIAQGRARIGTLEHLMAALYGLGVDNARIAMDAEEVPILDGSAQFYVEALARVGVVAQQAPRLKYRLSQEVEYVDAASGTRLTATPSDTFRVDLTIAFPSQILSSQEFTFIEGLTDFATEVAQARTFVFLHEVLPLVRMGLAKGGDLDNALVIAEQMPSAEDLQLIESLFGAQHGTFRNGYLNHTPLRYPNECARHKMLDLLGDLALVGCRYGAHITAYKPGHKANTALARLITQQLVPIQ